MRLLIYVVCFLTTFVGVLSDSSQQRPIQPTSDPFDPSFDEYVEDLLKECHVPGVSIAIVDNGRIASKVSIPCPLSMSCSLRLLSFPNLDRATASPLSPTKKPLEIRSTLLPAQQKLLLLQLRHYLFIMPVIQPFTGHLQST